MFVPCTAEAKSYVLKNNNFKIKSSKTLFLFIHSPDFAKEWNLCSNTDHCKEYDRLKFKSF